MKTTPRYLLRTLALLLRYPDAELRGQLPLLAGVLEADTTLGRSRRQELLALVTQLQQMDPYLSEARYVETFDRGRNTCLHLFEHVHGDSRDRGQALIDLMQTYEKAGLYLAEGEMPDHLCVALEFASTQPAKQARDFLAELTDILTAIFSALLKRDSPYASVIGAVLELAGQRAQAVAVPLEPALDEAWAEPEPFNGCNTQGQARPGAEQPIHFVRTTPAATGVRP